MELIEKDSMGNTCAKTRATIWANRLLDLRRKFYEATGKDIVSGIKVMVRGSSNYHKLYGFSFTITDIDPSYTVGDMERLRREILERLKREGIIDNNKSLSVPMLPQKIAVISAAGAAGYGDFMNQLINNQDGFKFYPFLFNAVMQGDNASRSIRGALATVRSTIDMWDCVVIIRGGGATTDLNGFDEYELAREIASFPLPVIVGIGHERDRTVLDEIACVRCKTPTAVAAFLIDSLRQAYTAVIDRVRLIAKNSVDAINGEIYRLANIETALPAKVKNRLMLEERRLTDTVHRVERTLTRKYNMEYERIGLLRYRYERALSTITEKPMMRLMNIEGMRRVLSPQNTINRGYSITRVNGKAVREVATLKQGDVIETQLSDGKVESMVK